MKISHKVSIGITAVSLALGLAAPLTAFAAITPDLGTAGAFGILANTFGYNGGLTSITGKLGYNSLAPGGGATLFVSGSTEDTTQARTDAGTAQNAALSTGPNNLNNQACTYSFPAGAIDLATDTTHGQIGVYAPGVYCITGTASIGTAGITLKGSGTYIFRMTGALTSVANSHVYSAGASSCDVFWTPGQATTLLANSTFFGTDIDAYGITIGSTVTWTGRALAYGGTVTADTDTINSTCTTGTAVAPKGGRNPQTGTINVVKVVINDSGGTKTVADFPLFVNGSLVVSGVTNSFPAPGAAYTVTETGNANYVQSFSGACDATGHIALSPGDNKVCIITNNDIGTPIAVVPPLIDVVKVPSPLALPNGPGPVSYTYTLHNIGTVPVTNITMVGDTCSPIVLASGDINNDKKLDVNETWVYKCSTTLSETHTNIVTATGWANGVSAVSIASATVVVGTAAVPPLIHVTKIPSPLALPAAGGMVIYTEKLTNPGTVALSNVTLTDDKCRPVTYVSGDTNNDKKLDVNETWAYTCQSTLNRSTTNTATAMGSANGMTATSFAVATVLVAAPTLPNTGLPLDTGTVSLDTILLAIILIVVVTSLVMTLRKRKM